MFILWSFRNCLGRRIGDLIEQFRPYIGELNARSVENCYTPVPSLMPLMALTATALSVVASRLSHSSSPIDRYKDD